MSRTVSNLVPDAKKSVNEGNTSDDILRIESYLKTRAVGLEATPLPDAFPATEPPTPIVRLPICLYQHELIVPTGAAYGEYSRLSRCP